VMSRLLLYEVNTRCWLADWSRRLGRAVGLDQVPTDDFERWRKLGFTHVWLMGVWTVGTRARQVALELPETGRRFDQALPGWAPADVLGSPYAIEAYRVPAALGGPPGLKRIRECLHTAGLQLLLDFVPNHVGLDHPWLRTRPDWFIAGTPASEGAFPQTTTRGERWLAHGKDPWFPPWIDTAQLDYTRADVRAAGISEL